MLLILLLTAGLARGAEDPVATARAAMLDGDPRAAVRVLKGVPGGQAQVLLGVAYLAEGNAFWAARTLSARLEQAPDDCAARTWLAWTHLQMSAPLDAMRVLPAGRCEGGDPLGVRADLLRAALAWSTGEQRVALEALERARTGTASYPEDRAALSVLSRMMVPERPAPLTWRLDARGGYASNALLGSPLDPADTGDPTGSPRLEGQGWLRWVPGWGARVRPDLRLQVRATEHTAPTAWPLSNASLGGRAGVRVDALSVGLRPEILWITGGTLTPWASSLRAEAEWSPASGWLAFGGGGRRVFTELGRNRTEADAGLGWSGAVGRGTLLTCASGRWHQARNAAWDLRGASLGATLRWPLGGGWQAWPALNLGGDLYPHSAGSFTAGVRRDDFEKLTLLAWSPALSGLRVGLSYELSHRGSTAEDYAFIDHRALLRLRWAGTADPGLPRAAEVAPIWPLGWQAVDQGEADERLEDVVRGEQQVEASCGCGQ